MDEKINFYSSWRRPDPVLLFRLRGKTLVDLKVAPKYAEIPMADKLKVRPETGNERRLADWNLKFTIMTKFVIITIIVKKFSANSCSQPHGSWPPSRSLQRSTKRPAWRTTCFLRNPSCHLLITPQLQASAFSQPGMNKFGNSWTVCFQYLSNTQNTKLPSFSPADQKFKRDCDSILRKKSAPAVQKSSWTPLKLGQIVDTIDLKSSKASSLEKPLTVP